MDVTPEMKKKLQGQAGLRRKKRRGLTSKY